MADQNADQGARGDEISAPGLAGGGGGGGGANERVMRWGMVVSPSSCGLPVTIDGNTVTNTGPWVANHDRPAQNARKKSILTLFGDKPMIPNTYFELQLHKRCDTHIGVATRDPCFRTPEVAGDATLLCLAGTNACVYTTYNGQTCSSDPRGRVELGPEACGRCQRQHCARGVALVLNRVAPGVSRERCAQWPCTDGFGW